MRAFTPRPKEHGAVAVLRITDTPHGHFSALPGCSYYRKLRTYKAVCWSTVYSETTNNLSVRE